MTMMISPFIATDYTIIRLMLIETHAHLDFKDFNQDRDETIARATAAGIAYIINVGADLTGSRASVRLADKYDNIYATVGVHPHDAGEATNDDNLNQLKNLAINDRVKAIGEIGMDYFRSRTSPSVQREAFINQLDLAVELNMPVIIHTRDAEEDVAAILRKYPGLQAVIHFFSGSPDFATMMIEMGFHVSFTGVVTFPPRRPGAGSGASYDTKREQIIRSIPANRLMIETDCPFAAPVPHRGTRNEPAFLVDVAKKIADIRAVSFEELSAQTTENARNFFNLPKII